jgi:hypothetical protein
MTDHDRLAQLRVLVERLEGMPASPDRDWMLAEVRSRAVDIDTGTAPRPMRALESGTTLEPEAVAPKRPLKVAPRAPAKPVVQRRVAPRIPAPAPRPAPEPAAEPPFWEATFPTPANRDDRVDLLAFDGLLSLGDDAPAKEPAEGEARTTRPWSGGLRG